MKKDKQLFLVSLYQRDEEGTVVQIKQPEWMVATDRDRVIAKALKDHLEDESWSVKIIQQVNF